VNGERFPVSGCRCTHHSLLAPVDGVRLPVSGLLTTHYSLLTTRYPLLATFPGAQRKVRTCESERCKVRQSAQLAPHYSPAYGGQATRSSLLTPVSGLHQCRFLPFVTFCEESGSGVRWSVAGVRLPVSGLLARLRRTSPSLLSTVSGLLSTHYPLLTTRYSLRSPATFDPFGDARPGRISVDQRALAVPRFCLRSLLATRYSLLATRLRRAGVAIRRASPPTASRSSCGGQASPRHFPGKQPNGRCG
jgi:hypothetical protein